MKNYYNKKLRTVPALMGAVIILTIFFPFSAIQAQNVPLPPPSDLQTPNNFDVVPKNKVRLIHCLAGTQYKDLSNADGGIAVTTNLFEPRTGQIDSKGNLYISEYKAEGNYGETLDPLLQKVDVNTGNIETLTLQNGSAYPSLIFDKNSGLNIGIGPEYYGFVLWDLCSDKSRKLDIHGDVKESSEISPILKTCFDNKGNLYVLTQGRGVFKISIESGETKLLASFTVDSLDPKGLERWGVDIAVDNENNLFIENDGRYGGGARIEKINLGSGQDSILVGGGSSIAEGVPAENCQFKLNTDEGNGLAVDSIGNLYFGNIVGFYGVVKVVDKNTGLVWTYAGGGKSSKFDGKDAKTALLKGITGLWFDKNDNLYISDYSYLEDARILKVDRQLHDSGYFEKGLGDQMADEAEKPLKLAKMAKDEEEKAESEKQIKEEDSNNLKIAKRSVSKFLKIFIKYSNKKDKETKAYGSPAELTAWYASASEMFWTTNKVISSESFQKKYHKLEKLHSACLGDGKVHIELLSLFLTYQKLFYEIGAADQMIDRFGFDSFYQQAQDSIVRYSQEWNDYKQADSDYGDWLSRQK